MFLLSPREWLCTLLVLWTAVAPPQAARADDGSRVALVVGNAAYSNNGLKNPENDAREVAAKLRRLGFEVTLLKNTNLSELLEAVKDLVHRAPNYDVRLFYYAGHAFQYQGGTYLVPIDAALNNPSVIATQTFRFDHLLERLSQVPSGINLYILDACRDNPYANSLAVDRDGRQIKMRSPSRPFQGLARPRTVSGGSLVAYSTTPGRTSLDSRADRNSVYTKHLLRHIETPGLTHDELFRRVRGDVLIETQGKQIPWEHTSLVEPFCFRVRDGQPCGS